MVSGTVAAGDQDVDPDVLNGGGIRFDFDREVRGNITIRPKDEEPLDWTTSIAGKTATLTPIAGRELQHGVVYVIHIEVVSIIEEKTEFTITFRTKDE